jgi:hypothetical protein
MKKRIYFFRYEGVLLCFALWIAIANAFWNSLLVDHYCSLSVLNDLLLFMC